MEWVINTSVNALPWLTRVKVKEAHSSMRYCEVCMAKAIIVEATRRSRTTVDLRYLH